MADSGGGPAEVESETAGEQRWWSALPQPGDERPPVGGVGGGDEEEKVR